MWIPKYYFFYYNLILQINPKKLVYERPNRVTKKDAYFCLILRSFSLLNICRIPFQISNTKCTHNSSSLSPHCVKIICQRSQHQLLESHKAFDALCRLSTSSSAFLNHPYEMLSPMQAAISMSSTITNKSIKSLIEMYMLFQSHVY